MSDVPERDLSKLTDVERETLLAVESCNGNFAAAGRKLGRTKTPTHQAYMRAMLKLHPELASESSLDQVFPGLPNSTNPVADAMWAFSEIGRIAVEGKNGRVKIVWKNCSTPPPSVGVEHWTTLRVKAS